MRSAKGANPKAIAPADLTGLRFRPQERGPNLSPLQPNSSLRSARLPQVKTLSKNLSLE
ncbi:hypothetical protein [Kamptonema formosum]|uniref:hypothetical protein n=1 Tax=Kamptonema formosum TaxID=331992 RepID=UPI000348E759|nr:hypothetical protein [Oscillatoria sp. PCC 10802]